MDLYERVWQGEPLGADDYVISADARAQPAHECRTRVRTQGLNQIEIYFSVVQRKVLTPNDFNSLAALEQRLVAFQDRYQTIAKPFRWRFTRSDLNSLLDKLNARAKAA